jgi:AcrR family transcriptional regulator
MDRRTQLLHTALELFDEQGVSGASMRELARRADVNVAAAYHYFPSKRGLLLAVFDELFDDVEWMEPERIADAATALRAMGTEDALRALIEGTLERLVDGGPFIRVVHVEQLHGDEDARAVGVEMWDRWFVIMRRFVVELELTVPERVDELARLLRAAIWGTFHELHQSGPPDAEAVSELSRGLASTLAHLLRSG